MADTPVEETPQVEETLVASEEERLISTAIEQEEWDLAIELYEDRTQKSRDPRVVGGAYKAMAQIALEKLENHDRARVYYEMAKECQQGDPEILDPLSKLYLEIDRLEDARKTLERLATARDPEENPSEIPSAAEDYRRLGRLAIQLGDTPGALSYYQNAWNLDPVDQETLEKLVSLFQEAQLFEEADHFEKALLYHHRQVLSSEKHAGLLTRAGMQRLENGYRALGLLKLLTALEVAPGLQAPREAVVSLYEKEESWPDVLTHRRALGEILSTAQERAENLRLIGEIYLHKLQDEDRAIETFREAVKAAPADPNIVGYLKSFYQEREEWHEIVILQELFANALEESAIKSQAYEELAELQTQYFHDKRAAVQSLHLALDADPSRTKSFDVLNEYLMQLGDLSGLEQSFLRMLERVGNHADLHIKLALYMGLGNVCREAQKRTEAAEAYEKAAELAPGDPRYRETLAEIYREDPATFSKAIEQHRLLLQLQPDRIASLHSLFELYAGADPERAFLVAGALCFLGAPNENEKAFYEQGLRKRKRVKAVLNEELWNRYISHPQEDAFLTAIFSHIGPYASQLYARAPKEFSLRGRDKMDLQKNADLAFVGALRYVCTAFGISSPQLYVPKGTHSLNFPSTLPPSVVIGRELLSGSTNQELIFSLGKSIAYFRPSYLLLHQLKGVFPEAPRHLPELRLIYLASLRLLDPEISIPPSDEPRIHPYLGKLKKVFPSEVIRQLQPYISRHRAEAERADIVRWVAHTELATNRAGFVLSGDLHEAIRGIEADEHPGQLTPREKIQDLVIYMYSEQHARLREALGLRVIT